MRMPTLYKRNTDGSTQEWTITAREDSDSDAGVISKDYGKVGGKMQYVDDVVSAGKNVGKANETSPFEQACKEAEAQWLGKKKKGYVESFSDAAMGAVDEVIAGGVVPMLAHSFKKSGEKISFPCFAQPKLDGIRCIAIVKDGRATLWTRTRKPILSMPHIVAWLEGYYADEDITLDGELYNHEYRNDFEKIVSLVRPAYAKPGHEVVHYHVYDVINGERFAVRRKDIPGSEIGAVRNVYTTVVIDEQDAMNLHRILVDDGYEGIMLRNGDSKYKHGRSYDLQKVKEFDDAEFEIVDVTEGRGRMAGKAIFSCITTDGGFFKVKMEGALDQLEKYLTDPPIHQMLTVRYQGLTNTNSVPRFPIGVSIRDYE